MSPYANYPSLHGKSIFITGGATGIGASLVEHFVAQGSNVTFIDIDDAAGTALSSDNRSQYIHCDVRDIAALRSTLSATGDVDVLINNAARDDRHWVDKVDVDYWDQSLALNLRPHFFAAQAVHAGMARRGGGSIINLGSVTVQMSAGEMAAYVTAKAGIYGLTRALARDLGKDRIRVNCLVPGWVMTERQRTLWLGADGKQRIGQRQCIPEELIPEDIARMALFLAADDSRHCTAQQFIVDGGWV